MLYNIDYDFSAWGDTVFLGLQTVVIAILVMHYSGETLKAASFLAAYLAVLFTANSGFTPIHVLWTCQTMNIPIILISKVCNLVIKTIVYLFLEISLLSLLLYLKLYISIFIIL